MTARPQSHEPMTEIRIDKWLWFARIFKTRSLAAKFVSTGHVRLTRTNMTGEQETTRVDKPKLLIREGDIINFAYANRLRILMIKDCGKRRGPAAEAQTLYEDRSPPPPEKQDKDMSGLPIREPGAGRPTKKERRAMDALKRE